MSLVQKQESLTAQLGAMKNSQERFAYVVRRGREYSALTEALKPQASRIEGCLAKVLFVSQFIDGKCYFVVDSDSLVVKGIAVILCEFYSGENPQDILRQDPSFLEKMGITQHLTPNRRNSLSRIWGHIQAFATAHCAQEKVS